MLIVQKYGGATLADPEKIKSAAHRISELKKKNIQIVAVVSAMGQTTNQLIDLAHNVSRSPNLRELDMLLSVGERISMSLVSIALNDLGHDAISFTGSQAGIFTDESHLGAMIKDVKAHRVQEALEKNKIVILAGFQGVSPVTKEITTLGRGGSDTSAVAMAAYLNADRCEILKDVSSIFTADPKLVKQAQKITQLNYDHLLEMTYWGAKVLHYRSVELAKLKKVKLYVGPAHDHNHGQSSEGTIIHEGVMFESSKPLAVNSHAKILEMAIHTETPAQAFEILFSALQKSNIAVPQILNGFVKSGKTHMLLTAPPEILAAIESMDFNKHNQVSVVNNKLCSVSLTCTGSTLNDTLMAVTQKLQQNNIQPAHFIQSAMSLNYILDLDSKDKAIQALHSLINA
ncbi:aspartate kinase [Bdellovibrio sp. qaytius]|nr:aspartate kinase [Bdellovibrio sp. qaytius]